MQNTSLEITEQEYLIKLSKEKFDLNFIHQLLNRIQSDKFFFSARTSGDTDDIGNQNTGTHDSVRFDNLGDK